MSTAVYLGKNLIGVPAERNPSMHALFYRIEACGEITVVSGYRVILKMPKEKYPLVAQHKDFYQCLLIIYRKLYKKLGVFNNESSKPNN